MRRGDGIYLRGNTWWLDFTFKGERYVARLAKGVNKTVARDLARVKRGEILTGASGIGPKGPKKDPTFEQARTAFLTWVATNKKPRTHQSYGECLTALGTVFGGRRLSQIDELSIERHKRTLVEAGHLVTATVGRGAPGDDQPVPGGLEDLRRTDPSDSTAQRAQGAPSLPRRRGGGPRAGRGP